VVSDTVFVLQYFPPLNAEWPLCIELLCCFIVRLLRHAFSELGWIGLLFPLC
jgi:hypothetical protein